MEFSAQNRAAGCFWARMSWQGKARVPGWEGVGLTCGWTSCRELKKGSKGGRPKWVMERRPVNRLRFSTFWKCRSQTYWGAQGQVRPKTIRASTQPEPAHIAQETETGEGRELEAEDQGHQLCASCQLSLAIHPPALAILPYAANPSVHQVALPVGP